MIRRLDTALLLVLLVIVGLRPLIGETFTSALDPVSAGVAGLEPVGLGRTLLLDLVALVAGGIALATRAGHAQRRGPSAGIEWGLLLFAVAALVACLAAGEKRAAVNAALDAVAALVTAVALVRLLDAPWRIGLALVVLLATSTANVADCVDDRRSAAQTRANYLDHREEIWASQGVPLDAPQVELFERRMLADEASGFFAHSNVAGGYLLLGLLVALGMTFACVAELRRGKAKTPAAADAPVVPVAGSLLGAGGLAVASAVAIWLTRSTGALVAAGLGVVLVAVRVPLAGWWMRHRRGVFVGGMAAVVAVAAAVVGFGLARGTLPHPSLAFRWQYWAASAGMFRDHLLTGVGPENFGNVYTQYKSIAASEEVKNPHDLFVQLATEYGGLGLLAGLIMLAGGAWRATAPARASLAAAGGAGVRARAAAGAGADAEYAELRRLALYVLLCGAAIFCVRVPLLESHDPNFIFWMTGYGGIFWAVGAAGGLLAFVAARRRVDWLAAGCSVGLLVFLVQDTINFAFFVPAARMSFAALLAVTVALRASGGEPPAPARRGDSRRTAAWAVAGVALLSAGVCVWQLAQVLPADRALQAARASVHAPQADGTDVVRRYDAAATADPLDPTAPTELSQWALRSAEGADREAAAHLADVGLAAGAEAIARNPQAFTLHTRMAQLHLVSALARGDAEEYGFAIAAAERAVRLYPAHPRNYVTLGDCHAAAGTCADARTAVAAFDQALALDAQRPAWEIIRRFNDRERADIAARRAAAAGLVAERCPPAE